MRPLLSPLETYEQVGDVPNVVFSCTALVDREADRVSIYYGAADTVVCLAHGHLFEVLGFVHLKCGASHALPRPPSQAASAGVKSSSRYVRKWRSWRLSSVGSPSARDRTYAPSNTASPSSASASRSTGRRAG